MIGWEEILLLMIFTLLVFGPKRLPEIARQVGRAVAEVRKVSREFEREVKDVIEPFEREIRQVTDPFEREFREAERAAGVSGPLDEDHSRFLTEGKPDQPAPRDQAP